MMMEAAATPPNATLVAFVNSLPRIVTVDPFPAESGEKEVMTGPPAARMKLAAWLPPKLTAETLRKFVPVIVTILSCRGHFFYFF